jgi:7-cyano-7-deazaguanine synthase in queuosine biosynthesis
MFGYIDKTAFLAWIKENFKGVLSTHFDYELAEGIIDYANSLEENVDLIYEIFPEITREEIEKFII